MTSGLDHSRAAEAILDELDADEDVTGLDPEVGLDVAIAQVHATLAVAGAVAALTRTLQRVFENDPARVRRIREARANSESEV